MAVITLVGDRTTTTAVAIAAAWPVSAGAGPVVVECDPTGGSLAAWLDTPVSPSITSVTAAVHRASGRDVGTGEPGDVPGRWNRDVVIEPTDGGRSVC